MKTLAQDDDRTEILRRLRHVRPDSARRWGHMSAHQMICHLGDACRMALGQKTVSAPALPLPRVLMKIGALYVPLKWPRNVQTSPEIDQRSHGTAPGDFGSDVAELETLLELVASRAANADWPEHPVFGRMSHTLWLRWAYLHADHHLRQFGA